MIKIDRAFTYLSKFSVLLICVVGWVIIDTDGVLAKSATLLKAEDLVDEYYQRGEYEKAILSQTEVLKLTRQELGPDHPDMATSINNLAVLYDNQGLYEKAEPLYQRALAIREKALGPDHPDVATSLNNLGGLYATQGLYEKAEPLHKRALSINEKALGPDHPDVAVSLNHLGGLYIELGLYAKAEPLGRRSLAIREKALGPEHPKVALALNNLAELYVIQGLYDEAEPLQIRALAIRENALGLDHPDVAGSLNSLAGLYVNQGSYAKAESLHQRALAIRENALGPDHPDVAESLSNLAELYRTQGSYEKTEPLYQRALAIGEKALGPDHPDVAASLNNLAGLYLDLGSYAKAEPLYKRSLAIDEMAFGPNHPDVAIGLHNLAFLYERQGLYVKAEPLYKRSLEIDEKVFGPFHPNLADGFDNLALLYAAQGSYSLAEPLYQRALAIKEKTLGPNHPNVAISLNNLASLYDYQGSYSKAEPLYKRALVIWEMALGPDHTKVSDVLNNLALLYANQQVYPRAEQLYKRSLAISEKAFGPNHTDVAIILGNMAAFYSDQELHAKAEPLYERALAIWEKMLGLDHPDVANSLNNLALLYGNQGRNDVAYDYALRSASIMEKRRFDSSVQRQDQLAIGREDSAGFETAISLAWKLSSENPSRLSELVEQSFRMAQLSGGSSTAAALNQMAARFGSGDTELAGLVRERQDTARHWQALDKRLIEALGLPEENRNDELIASLRQNIADANAKLKELDGVLASEFPRFAELSNPRPLQLSDVQGLLKPDEALLSYHVSPDETFVWAVTQDDVRWSQSALGSNDLQDKVARLREGLDVAGGSGLGVFDPGLAHELYAELIGPVADLVSSKQNLLIAADGALTSLPFHVLVSEEPPQRVADQVIDYGNLAWLLKSHATTTLPSVSSLKALRLDAEKNQAPQPMIGFGDPVFARDESGDAEPLVLSLRNYASYFRGEFGDLDAMSKGLSRLPETADELRAVASTLGADSDAIKLRKAASERTVKGSPLDDYGVVYFATHALVAGETRSFGSRAEPALALSLPDEATEEDDGLLMASEVAQLELDADWVVLSACNTAAGDEPGAEALSGLARAFFYAGARSLLVSHWPVESTAAVKLTTNTFEAMVTQPELGRSQALRQSMLALMNDDSRPHNAHPSIWAPFVIVGQGK